MWPDLNMTKLMQHRIKDLLERKESQIIIESPQTNPHLPTFVNVEPQQTRMATKPKGK